MVLGRQTITFGTRKARVPAAEVLRAPEWPCAGRAPCGTASGPKMTQSNQKSASVGGPRKFRCPSLRTKSTWVLFGWPLGRVWTHVAPKRCPLGPNWVHLGPECVLPAETEKWPYLRLDGPNRESLETFPRANPHFRWLPPLSLSLSLGHVRPPFFSTPQNGVNAPLQPVFGPLGACLAAFWGMLACACPPKRGQKRSKMGQK